MNESSPTRSPTTTETSSSRRHSPVALSARLSRRWSWRLSSCAPVAHRRPLTPHPHGVLIADFDSDRKLDAATDSWGNNQIESLRGDGTGRLLTPRKYFPTTSLRALSPIRSSSMECRALACSRLCVQLASRERARALFTARPMKHPEHVPEPIRFPPGTWCQRFDTAGSCSCAEIREQKSGIAKFTFDIDGKSTTIWLWIDWV